MKKKQTLKTEVEKTIKLLMITLGVLIVALLVIFLFMTGRQSELGYRLEQARAINEELKDVSQQLKAQVTTAGTSDELQDNDKTDEMTTPDPTATKYLLPKDNN